MKKLKTTKKTTRKPRNVSKEPLQEHSRAVRGGGRVPVTAIMVPKAIKEELDCFKEAYTERFGAITYEQLLRRWMDGLGTEFDVTIAREARKKHRQLMAEKKAAEKAEVTEAPTESEQ